MRIPGETGMVRLEGKTEDDPTYLLVLELHPQGVFEEPGYIFLLGFTLLPLLC